MKKTGYKKMFWLIKTIFIGLLSKCAVCDHTKLSFIKKQEASWLLSKP